MASPLPEEVIGHHRARHERLRALGADDLEALLALLRGAASVRGVLDVLHAGAPAEGYAVALRHDVDYDLDNAVRFAELEAELGLSSSYFLLHTDWYYRSTAAGPPSEYLLRAASRIAELGHEVALHNNAIAQALRLGGDPAELLARELAWLCDAGFDVRGTVAHGDPLCHQVGFINHELFAETPYPKAGAPTRTLSHTDPESGRTRTLRLAPVPMAQFGLEYEANFVSRTHYLSDTGGGFRPPLDELAGRLPDGSILQALVHPVWWALSGERHTPRAVRYPARSRLVEGRGQAAEQAAPPLASSSAKALEYDDHYSSGGFRYATRRKTWLAWTQRHYIEPFGLKPGSTLLDIGCGDGFWTSLFAQKGFDCTGVDFSVKGIETARRMHPYAEYHVRDAERPLFDPTRTFDVVFCRAISHLCAKPLINTAMLKVMASMRECLADGGVFLLSYWSRRNHEDVRECADHTVAELTELVERFLEPFSFQLVGNYVQIGARRRRRESHFASST